MTYRVRLCRQCRIDLERTWHWCSDCWIQFWKGAAYTAGAALVTWLLT